MIKLYINRDGDYARRDAMRTTFPEFARFPAAEGLTWITGQYDDKGMPVWKPVERAKWVTFGYLHKDSAMSPTEFACAWSHLLAWKLFLETKFLCFTDTKHSTAVILEDDVRPTAACDFAHAEARLPDNAPGWIYLFSPRHPGQRIGLQSDGRVRWSRSQMGVMMNRAGAEAAIKAMTPVHSMHTRQIPERICATYAKSPTLPDDLPVLPKIDMYGLWEGMVELDPERARESTLVRGGVKKWIPADLR